MLISIPKENNDNFFEDSSLLAIYKCILNFYINIELEKYIVKKREILNNTFKEIEDITDVHQMTNQQLKRLIQKIEVDKDGNVDIYLRLLGDLGLDESVLIEENETVLNCDDQT